MSEFANLLTKHDLEELLKSRLDAEGSEIEDVSTTLLTKPGDNAGSILLAVQVIPKPGTRTLHLVAKMLPRSTALKEMFQVDVTVRKEIDTYLLIRPAFERVQKENNVPEDKFLDVFAECYGARISSKGDSAPVDDGSVILQENLKVRGYETGDRLNGLNLEHCKLVIDKLARFHATAIAIKMKKPEEFKTITLRTGSVVVVGPNESFAKPIESILDNETMKKRVMTAVHKSKKVFENTNPKPPREPFATITHLDLWVNNIMFSYGSGSTKEIPVDMKLVDFQITRYDSPARDLLFFLYSSVKLEVLSEHYDYLVRFYYDNFIDCLQLLGCDTAPFPFEEFLKEIEISSEIEFWHLVFMITALNLSSESAPDTADPNQKGPNHLTFKMANTFPDKANKLILDFASRNWI